MNTPFIPIQGKRDTIQAQAIIEGNLYFATDTGEMFLDTANERIPVGGGGVSVLYATAASVSQDLTDLSYIIYFADLEDQDASPKKDDLIINSNGTFYKVRSYNKSVGILKCSRIAVSGTGGGGGSGGGGGGDTGDGKYVELACEGTAPNAQTYIFEQPQFIHFSVGASHDSVLILNYHVTNVATEQSNTYSFSVRSGETHDFDLGSVLGKGQNTLVVEAIGSNSGTNQLQYGSISCIELALKESSNFNPLKYAYNSDMSFHFIPVGTVKKRLNVYIDGVLEESACKDLLATDNEQSMSVTIPKKKHGVYTLKAELTYNTGVTTIATKPLIYQIVFLEPNNDAPVIWFNNVPEKITNHDKLNIQYMVYDPASPDRTSIRRWINNNEIASLDNIAHSETTWLNWNISNYEVGENTFTLMCGTTSASVSLYVEEDELRDLDILTSDLYLNLTSVGRSNSENETERQTWFFERSDGTKSVVKFNNFNWYNNGWVNDLATGDSVLRISNGASIEIPVSVMNTRDLDTNLTFEIQFKLRNVQKYENLIEVTSEEIKDAEGNTVEVKVTKTVKSTDGVWCNYYDNEIGMCLGTQEGFFKSKQVIASGRYKEDEILTVSFVAEKAAATNQYPLIYMYINGIMSSIINYDKTSDSFASGVKTLVINSNYCDVDLYKVRIYQAALSSADVVHNYIADQNSAELYDMNQIIEFKDNIPSISYTKMRDYNDAHPESPLQAYAVLECVDKTEDLLPYIKGGKKKVNVTFVNPSLDYAYKNKLITGAQYLMGCPSYTATNIEFDVQGTSSQGYPRRNYKGKFKKKDDNSWKYTDGPLAGKEIGEKNEYEGVEYKGFYMDNHYSETTFTWKADYMESSMTHNTGYASFVKTLYSKHPLQDYDPDIDVTDRRTTVYGFPMIVFQKKADGSYEFIGRYNYNLDKGCNNVIGFEDETAHPYVEGKTFKDVAECWELLNNQGGRTSFTVTNFDEVDDEGKLAVLNDFEYRYHVDEDDIDDALDKKNDFANKTQAEINAFLLSKYDNLRKVAEWLESTNSLAPTNEPIEPYTAGGQTYTTDSAEYRLAKFANEFDKWFDQEYCAIYFIMTEMLLLYDSRGKNMMLATWGPQEVGGNYIWYPIFYDIDTQLGVNNSGVPSWEYDVEPSPIVNTEGGIFSTAGSVLWYNFEKCFLDTAKSYYQDIRKNGLKYEKLKGYYDYDANVSGSYAMMGHRPVNIINVDQYWKYIAPTFSGYINTSGTISKDEGKRFYCLQGSRQLHRDLFLRNRFNYIDSKWLGDTYAYEGAVSQLQIRCNANYGGTSDKYLNREITAEDTGFEQYTYPHPLDADLTFEVTPYLQQYNSLWFDKTMMTFPQKWDGKNPNKLQLTAEKQAAVETYKGLTQQLFYIGGGEYISSLGDLSLKYPDELYLTALKRLRDVRVGNDTPGFYNGILKVFTLGASALNPDGTPNENTKALLEQVILTNVQSLTGAIDVTGAEKLKEFRALGTTITGVSFADGGQMEIVHLPNTIAHLTFIEPIKLKGLIQGESDWKDAKGNFVPGLYIPGITSTGNLNASTSIEKLQVVGGNMGYSSYQLMKNLVDIKKTMQASAEFTNAQKNISIALEKVLWSPYKLVESGVAKDSEKSYVLKTENSTFIPYSPTDADWDQNTLNALVYEVLPDALNDQDCLTDLSLINLFIGEENLAARDTNYFRDITEYGDDRPTYPYLSGDIFINNPSTSKISEFEIKQIMDTYYPDLNIFVANVDPAYTLKMVEIVTDAEAGTKQTIELQSVKYDKSSTTPIKVTDIKANPSRLHHYFKGWSLTEDGEVLSNEEIEALTFSASKMTHILYAVFDWDSYTATFYNGDVELGEKPTVIYGQYFYEPAEVPSREADEESLPLTERLAFYGWSDKYQANPVAPSEEAAAKLVIDVTAVKAIENRNFYAIFVQENVYSKATDEKYFEFVGPVTVNNVEGYQIRTSSAYDLKGKITIPATHNGLPIVSMGYFTSALRATGIFFMDNIFFYEVGTEAFKTDMHSADIKLKGVYLPESVMYIRDSAFNGVQGLEHVSEQYVKDGIVGHLSDNLVYIGTRAFYNTKTLYVANLPSKLTIVKDSSFYGAGKNVTLSTLSDNITKIEMAAFMQCPNIQITNFGKQANEIGSSSGLSYIGTYAFANAGLTGAHSSIKSIFIWDTVTSIEANAFMSYGSNITAYTSFAEAPTGWTDVAIKGPSALGLANIEYNYTGEV